MPMFCVVFFCHYFLYWPILGKAVLIFSLFYHYGKEYLHYTYIQRVFSNI